MFPIEIWITIIQCGLQIQDPYMFKIQKINKYFYNIIRSSVWNHTIRIKDEKKIEYVLKNYHFKKYDFSLALIKDYHIQFIKDHVTKLNLKFCINLTHEGIKYLSRLPNLKSLQLSFCPQIKNESIQLLTNLKSLNISFSGDYLSDDAIKSLTNLKKLKMIECTKFTNQILPYLSSLDYLDITGSNLNGKNLGYLKNIKHLAYGSNELSKDDLQLITAPDRNLLNLTFCKGLRDSDLQYLGKINCLNLSLNYITDELFNLSSLKDIKILNISNTKYISGKGILNNLHKLENLEKLYVDQNKFNDMEIELLLKSKVNFI